MLRLVPQIHENLPTAHIIIQVRTGSLFVFEKQLRRDIYIAHTFPVSGLLCLFDGCRCRLDLAARLSELELVLFNEITYLGIWLVAGLLGAASSLLTIYFELGGGSGPTKHVFEFLEINPLPRLLFLRFWQVF